MLAGDKAPDFTLWDHTGRPQTLSMLLSDGPVVLFFFPLASSPICTAQACHFRDLSNEFAMVGAQRVGISTDAVDRQAHFAQQRSFDYPLLSDPDGVVCELFGVRRGRLARLRRTDLRRGRVRHRRRARRRGLLARLLPVRRTTFVIDTDRTVLKVVSSELRASVHAAQALWFLQHRKVHEHAQQRPHEAVPATAEFTESPTTVGGTDVGADLPLEATLEVREDSPNSPRWPRNDVRGQILTCCAYRPTIAELAAQLSLPTGATKFLVGELVTAGQLRVLAPSARSTSIDERRELIERTLRGLRAL